MAPDDIRSRQTTVYRAYCEHGSLLYVGVAVDVNRRLHQHKHTKSWWADVRIVFTDVYASRLQALKVEAYYITYFCPKYNVLGKSQLPRMPHPVVSDSFYLSVNGRLVSESDVRAEAALDRDV